MSVDKEFFSIISFDFSLPPFCSSLAFIAIIWFILSAEIMPIILVVGISFGWNSKQKKCPQLSYLLKAISHEFMTFKQFACLCWFSQHILACPLTSLETVSLYSSLEAKGRFLALYFSCEHCDVFSISIRSLFPIFFHIRISFLFVTDSSSFFPVSFWRK